MLFSGKRPLTIATFKKIERFIRPKASATLEAALTSFVQSPAHKSAKTVETLQVRFTPFVEYLAESNVESALDITYEHVEGFLGRISQGRRGRPLGPGSLFDYTKDVQAFLNFVAKALAPEDWRNPARFMVCRHPQVTDLTPKN